MASKRELKKDIRSITEQIIIDALEFGGLLKNEENHKKLLDIIISITQTHNDLIARVNHPDGKDNPKLVKKHFDSISSDLMTSYSKAYEELAAIKEE